MSSGLHGVGLNDTIARLMGWTPRRDGRRGHVWTRETNPALPHRKLLRWYNVMPPAYDRTSELMVELMREHHIAAFAVECDWAAVWPGATDTSQYEVEHGFIDVSSTSDHVHVADTPMAAVAACALHHLWVVPLEAAR